jgi:hypothetical protein
MSSMTFAASFDVTVDDADLDPLGELVHRHQDVLVAVMVVLNGPTESRPHIAKGQEGGIVLRT